VRRVPVDRRRVRGVALVVRDRAARLGGIEYWRVGRCIPREPVRPAGPFDEAVLLIAAQGTSEAQVPPRADWEVSPLPGGDERLEVPSDPLSVRTLGLVAVRDGEQWYPLAQYSLGHRHEGRRAMPQSELAIGTRGEWLEVEYTQILGALYRRTARGVDLFTMRQQQQPVRLASLVEQSTMIDTEDECTRGCRGAACECERLVVLSRTVEWLDAERVRIGEYQRTNVRDFARLRRAPRTTDDGAVLTVEECVPAGECQPACLTTEWDRPH